MHFELVHQYVYVVHICLTCRYVQCIYGKKSLKQELSYMIREHLYMISHVYNTVNLITLITSFVHGCGVSSQTLCFQICNALTYLARIYWHPVFCHIPPQPTGCSVKRSHNIVRCTARRFLWPVAQIHQPVFCCSRSELGRREMQAYL